MKLNIRPLNHKSLIVTISALLWIVISFSGPSLTCAGPNDPNKSNAVINTSIVERMNTHFTTLHEKLKITKDQENQWSEFTHVMMENTKVMRDLQEKRQKEVRLMNALEDLKSYSEIADAHANSLKKFIPAFEALYNSMTGEQKKNADNLFLNQREIMANKKTAE